jgi:uncharacterized protein (UPF0276 family)
MSLDPIHGVGLGFRLGLAEALLGAPTSRASFLEVCPENYVGLGGKRARLLQQARERWPLVCHGLCGDLAGTAPLQRELLADIGAFLKQLGARWYSDHLCMTNVDGAEIHELVALPFTEEAVRRAAQRIRAVQDILDLPMAVENVSAYGIMPGSHMTEPEFVNAVLQEADCKLLLDVNNVYVNAVNFRFDPYAYIDAMPLERVVQLHVAGHAREADDLLLDTHAMPIADPVYALFAYTARRLPRPVPVLLERDGNFPPLAELEDELHRLDQILRAETSR